MANASEFPSENYIMTYHVQVRVDKQLRMKKTSFSFSYRVSKKNARSLRAGAP